MFTGQEARALIGATAYDHRGQEIGEVTRVYFRQASGEPEWLAVKTTGLVGQRETFAPLARAQVRGPHEVQFDITTDVIKRAPEVPPDGRVSPSAEAEIFQHYGMAEGDRRGPTGVPGTSTQLPGGADDAMTRSEERMHAGAVTRRSGRVRARKYADTEDVQQSVPVTREEVRVDREPVTGASRDAAVSGPDSSGAEHEFTLYEERPVVVKETVPVERVRLSKQRVTGEETVTGKLRKERIEIEDDQDTRR